jgi:molybdopterin converting factor small subunit
MEMIINTKASRKTTSGRDIPAREERGQGLAPGDRLTLIPPIAGG